MSAGNGKKPPEVDSKRRAVTKAPVAIKPKGGSRAVGATRVATTDTTPPKPPPPTGPTSSTRPPKSPGNDSAPEPATLEQPPPPPPPVTAPPATPSASRLFVVCITLLLGGSAGAGYYLLWQRQDHLETRLAAPMESLARRVAVLESHPVGIGERLGTLEAEIAEVRLTTNADNLLWALAEIESLMVLAMHRLDLQADVAGALAALQAADVRLEGLTDVGLLPVREQLRADIDALYAVNEPDLRELSNRLINLYQSIRHLPGRKSPGEATSPSQEYTQWLQRLGHWVTSRVSVRRAMDSTGLMYAGLKQEQAAGLARLEIENARLSLQARDEQSFRVALRVISDLLMTHYDTEQTSVRNTLAMLEELKLIQLEPELPDLSSSIEALRAYFHARFSGGS